MRQFTVSAPNAERFWRYVDRGGPDECWLWKGAVGTRGYGNFNVNGAVLKAHRVAYAIANAQLDSRLYVLHTCDVPLCCNPAHLYAGTALDNKRDAIDRGRLNPHKSAYTVQQVQAMRDMFEGGMTYQQIADYLGLPHGTVWNLVTGRTKPS
jgi:hypothetical protein